MNRKIKLSPREAMLLESFKADRSYKEAARELNITVNTVQGLAKRLYYKLDAKDKLDAVLIGLRNGLISLSLIFSIIGGLTDGDADEMLRGTRTARRERQTITNGEHRNGIRSRTQAPTGTRTQSKTARA